jgi:hypothetical protein
MHRLRQQATSHRKVSRAHAEIIAFQPLARDLGPDRRAYAP